MGNLQFGQATSKVFNSLQHPKQRAGPSVSLNGAITRGSSCRIMDPGQLYILKICIALYHNFNYYYLPASMLLDATK